MEKLIDYYKQFKTLFKGEKIENPEYLVFVCDLSRVVLDHVPLQSSTLYISLRSLKHIAEKQNDIFLQSIFGICENPLEIRKSVNPNRYLLIRNNINLGNRPYVACIEITKKSTALLITVFASDDKYLSNFDLLWRTGVS